MAIRSFYEKTTKKFTVTITENNVAPDISSDEVWLSIKKNRDDVANVYYGTADVTTYGATGIADFVLGTTDTSIEPATYFYSMLWKKSNGEEYVLEAGSLEVLDQNGVKAPVQDKTKLCSVDDIKRVINTIGRWDDDEIYNAILDTDEEIYVEVGTPVQGIVSDTGQIDGVYQNKFYVGEENIYRIDRLFYTTAGNTTELFENAGFRTDLSHGLIKILPVASSGVTLGDGHDVEIRYVPKIFHRLAIYTTIQKLLEKSDLTASGKPSKELQAIEKKLSDIYAQLQNKYALQLSSQVDYYDGTYYCNGKKLTQDFYRNNYISSSGW
jgi:hypothetical protein